MNIKSYIHHPQEILAFLKVLSDLKYILYSDGRGEVRLERGSEPFVYYEIHITKEIFWAAFEEFETLVDDILYDNMKEYTGQDFPQYTRAILNNGRKVRLLTKEGDNIKVYSEVEKTFVKQSSIGLISALIP